MSGVKRSGRKVVRIGIRVVVRSVVTIGASILSCGIEPNEWWSHPCTGTLEMNDSGVNRS